jgi:hypothetical protein
MKLSSLFITAALLSSFAVKASDYTYKCTQRLDRSPVDANVGKISVTVTHLETLATATKYRGQYVDQIDKVKVDITTTKNKKTTTVKSVNATATSEDVGYKIADSGVSFYLYLDEFEEAGVKTVIKGKKIDVALTCE